LSNRKKLTEKDGSFTYKGDLDFLPRENTPEAKGYAQILKEALVRKFKVELPVQDAVVGGGDDLEGRRMTKEQKILAMTANTKKWLGLSKQLQEDRALATAKVLAADFGIHKDPTFRPRLNVSVSPDFLVQPTKESK